MTPTRARKLLPGQTNLAQKVFEAVPVQEAWNITQINQELLRLATCGPITIPVLQGCLQCLDRAGLITESPRGMYRSAVRATKATKPANGYHPAAGIPDGEPMSVAPSIHMPAQAAKVALPQTTFEQLADLAATVISLADDTRQNLNKARRYHLELNAITADHRRELDAILAEHRRVLDDILAQHRNKAEQIDAMGRDLDAFIETNQNKMNKLTRVGRELEEVALSVQQEREQTAESMDKFRSLQNILRGIQAPLQ